MPLSKQEELFDFAS